MWTGYLCVWVYVWIEGRVGAVGPVWALQWGVLLTVTGRYFFVVILCFFLACVCYAFVSVCSFVPCGHLLGKG